MNHNKGFVEIEEKNLARQIAKEQIAPQAAERDKSGAFPIDAIPSYRGNRHFGNGC
jgi:hypothetical protein